GLLVMVTVSFFRERESSYNGRALSDWIKILSKRDGSDLETARAESAIRQIGTNAIPWLLKWIEYEDSPRQAEWRDRFREAGSWFGYKFLGQPIMLFRDPNQRRYEATR